MKKGIIVGTALAGIAGGFIIAQGTLFGSAEAQITAAEAKKIALEAYNGTVVEFDFDQDDITPHYEFDIKNGTEKAEVFVDATSGAVTIKEVEWAKNSVAAKVEDTAGAAKSDAQIALNDATKTTTESKGTVEKSTETVKASQTQTAVKETAKNTAPATAPKTGQISKAEAINIAYTVATGTVIKAELDSDDGRLTYEVDLLDGNTEFEVEIDASSGKIIGFSKELEDDNDYDDDDRYDD